MAKRKKQMPGEKSKAGGVDGYTFSVMISLLAIIVGFGCYFFGSQPQSQSKSIPKSTASSTESFDWDPSNDEERKDTFTRIYEKNSWQSGESRSGWGSQLEYTKNTRSFISAALKNFNIKTFLDAPCGDVNWQTKIEGINKIKYTGVDIVDEVIKRNKKKFHSNSWMTFRAVDLVKGPIDKYDMIMCRDALQHMHQAEAMKVLKMFDDSGSGYLITNFHNHSGFAGLGLNPNFIGHPSRKFVGFYPINVMQEPFNFPPPLMVTAEGTTGRDKQFADDGKMIGIWKLPITSQVRNRKPKSSWYDEAQNVFRHTLNRRDSVEAQIGLGAALFTYNQPDLAKNVYQAALRSNEAEARRLQSDILLQKGQLNDAEKGYRRALQLQPKNAEAYFGLFQIMMMSDRQDEVEQYFQKVAELNPTMLQEKLAEIKGQNRRT